MLDEQIDPTQDPKEENPFELPESTAEVAGLSTSVLRGIFKSVKEPVRQVAKKELIKPVEKPIEKKAIEAADKPIVDESKVNLDQVESEAKKVEELKFSDFDTDETYQINFDMIETTDEVKAVIAETGQRLKGTIDEARRGVITNNELQGLADDLNMKVDVILPVLERESGGTLNAETILGARKVLNSSAKRITELAKKVSSKEATDKERLSFARQIQLHNEYQTQFMGMRAEAGRALNAFGIPVGDDPVSLKRLSELVDTVQGGNIDVMAEALANADTVAEVGKLTKLNWKEKVGGVLFENFVNSILSGVKTHVINTSGNALFQTMNLAETSIAAQIGRFSSSEEKVIIGEAKARLFGSISAFKDALKVGWKGLKSGEGAETSKIETKYKKMISAETLDISGPVGRVVDFIGATIRIPTERMLTAEDEFFKTIARRGTLAQQAYREAMKKAEAGNLNSEQMAQLIKEYMDNPQESAFQKMDAEALYQTFQNPLGEKGRAAQKFVQQIPGLRYLAPFMRTPINIFKAGLLERSPLAGFSRQFREDIKTGGATRDMALARVSMGTITMASVAVAVDSGGITGGGPSNPAARKALMATGWKPYSIVYDDPITGKRQYQSYQRAEPLSYVIGATADMVEISKYMDVDDETIDSDEKTMRIGAAIIAGIAENTMSKTFVSGISDFTKMMEDPKRYSKNWAQRMAGAQIPFSALRRDLSKIQDPYLRDAWDFKEKLKATGGIPGWSEDSPNRLDLYGEPIYHMNGDIMGVLSPFPNSPMTTDPVKLEVARVMTESRRVAISMPAKRIEGLKLTNKEYYSLVSQSRSELKLSGLNFSEALRKTINSELYKGATVDTQATLLKNIQRGFDKAAKAKLYQNDPEFRDRLDRFRAVKAKRQIGEENLPENIQNLLN